MSDFWVGVIAAIVVGPIVLALAVVFWLLVTRRQHIGSPREAAAFLRAQGKDFIRLPGRLRRLAADPRVPKRARWLIIGLAAYLVSPLDLIPDFIPVLGQLDDVAVGGFVLWLVWRAVPRDVWREYFPPREQPDAPPEAPPADVTAPPASDRAQPVPPPPSPDQPSPD